MRWDWLCKSILALALSVAAAKPSIAITDFAAAGIAESDAELITAKFQASLVRTKVFSVLERNQLESILAEQGFQQSGACDSEECKVKIGQMLGVEYLIIGNVGRIGRQYVSNVRVLDVGSGEVIHTVDEAYASSIEAMYNEAIPTQARAVAARFASGGVVAPAKVNKPTVKLAAKSGKVSSAYRGITGAIVVPADSVAYYQNLVDTYNQQGKAQRSKGTALLWTGIGGIVLGVAIMVVGFSEASSCTTEEYDSYNSSTSCDDDLTGALLLGELVGVAGGAALTTGIIFRSLGSNKLRNAKRFDDKVQYWKIQPQGVSTLELKLMPLVLPQEKAVGAALALGF